MAQIEDYNTNPALALIDAVDDPIFKHFIKASDIELVVLTQNGMQHQARALKKGSVGQVLQRALTEFQSAGLNLLHLICSPEEFNLCQVLNNSLPGVAMGMLNEFLTNRLTQWATAGAGLFTAFTASSLAVAVGKFIAIFVAIGLVHGELNKLCKCPDA